MRAIAIHLCASLFVVACGSDDASTGSDDTTDTSAGPSSSGDTPATMTDPTNVTLDSSGGSSCGDACPADTSTGDSSTGSATAVDRTIWSATA